MTDITEFIAATDPLTKPIVEALIEHKEEDDRVDYKQTLDATSEKQRLSLTKDI